MAFPEPWAFAVFMGFVAVLLLFTKE